MSETDDAGAAPAHGNGTAATDGVPALVISIALVVFSVGETDFHLRIED